MRTLVQNKLCAGPALIGIPLCCREPPLGGHMQTHAVQQSRVPQTACDVT
jgi:hypothetical protein